MKRQTVSNWLDTHQWWWVMDLFMSFCFQLYTCWCTMSFSSCLCGRTGRPSSPSPWTPWRRWVCLSTALGWRGMVGSADVGYSLPVWLNVAFRLIILSSGSAWSCSVMAVILTTALQLCRVKHTHACILERSQRCISVLTQAKHTCRR